MTWEVIAADRLKRIRWRVVYLNNLGHALAYPASQSPKGSPLRQEAKQRIKRIIGVLADLEQDIAFYTSLAGTVAPGVCPHPEEMR